MLPLLFLALTVLVTYLIIRLAVKHGILDADDARAARVLVDDLEA